MKGGKYSQSNKIPRRHSPDHSTFLDQCRKRHNKDMGTDGRHNATYNDKLWRPEPNRARTGRAPPNRSTMENWVLLIQPSGRRIMSPPPLGELR